MQQTAYKTVAENGSSQFIINKSRFIGYAAPCETEAEALAAEGYLPCGLSQTGRVCPDCGSFLGRFREGIAGMRYYDTAKQRSRMAETVQTELYFCRACRRTYG